MALFGGKKANTTFPPGTDIKGLLRPEPRSTLLSTPRRLLLLQHIWQRTSLSRTQFATLYRGPIERYAALVQHFPASETHHHAYAGGMLDHGLEIVAFGLKLRQSYLLPVGAAPEVQAAEAEAWTAATAYAALLHDIGKVAVDLQVEYADGTPWHPWHGPLSRPYRFRFRAGRVHRLHEAAAGLVYSDVLGATILDWLSGFSELWAALLYVLAGHYEHAGTLGELVMQADRASVAQALGGDPAKARSRPEQSLQRKLLEGLRYLVRERFKLNQPQASDGWLTEDGLWLVSKTACDKLRAHLLSNGISGVPDKNTVLFDILQEHGLVQATPEGKAIWIARVVGENGWSQEFTFLKLSPPLVWEMGERPPLFRGSVRLATQQMPVDAVGSPESLQSTTHGSELARPVTHSSIVQKQEPDADAADKRSTTVGPGAPPTAPPYQQLDIGGRGEVPESAAEAQDCDATAKASPLQPTVTFSPQVEKLGELFLTWLQESVKMRRLIVNDAKALVHTVAGTVCLVSPGIFKRFLDEHPDLRLGSRESALRVMQKAFEKLGKHRRQPGGGLNIWTFAVSGPRKSGRVHGYLLRDGTDIFAEIPPDNPYLRLLP